MSIVLQMHETSEYKALQKKANVRLAKAAKDLADARDRERSARSTIQQVTEQLLVSERRCVLLEDSLSQTETQRAETQVCVLCVMCRALCAVQPPPFVPRSHTGCLELATLTVATMLLYSLSQAAYDDFKKAHEEMFISTRAKIKELQDALEEQRHAVGDGPLNGVALCMRAPSCLTPWVRSLCSSPVPTPSILRAWRPSVSWRSESNAFEQSTPSKWKLCRSWKRASASKWHCDTTWRSPGTKCKNGWNRLRQNSSKCQQTTRSCNERSKASLSSASWCVESHRDDDAARSSCKSVMSCLGSDVFATPTTRSLLQAKRQRSTMKVLRDQLAEARQRANALGRSQVRWMWGTCLSTCLPAPALWIVPAVS